MSAKLLTIVIPVYNVERFINECMFSVVHSTHPTNLERLEVILVDDKSQDGSYDLAVAFKEKYPTIVKIIRHETNSGLGAARNTGIDNAVGAFITFIDSDDWYAPEAVNYIMSQISSLTQEDILLFGLSAVKDEQVVWKYLPSEKLGSAESSFGSEDALRLFSIDKITPSATNKVFPSALLKQVRFTPSIYYEDLEFTPRAISLCKVVLVLDIPLLNYRLEGSSITRQTTQIKHVRDLANVIRSIYEHITINDIVTNIFLNRWAFVFQQWNVTEEIYEDALKEIADFLELHRIEDYHAIAYSKFNRWLDIHFQQYRSNQKISSLYWEVLGKLANSTDNDYVPLLSIIIPVFNAELYIESALENLSSQVFPDFEVIFVDDASTDRSAEIILQAQDKYDFIRYIRLKKNRGAGVARNSGLTNARGTYILFNDADDSLEPSALLEIFTEIESSNNPDLVVFGFSVCDEKKTFQWGSSKIDELPDTLTSGVDIFKEVCNSTINPAPWNKVFKRETWIKHNIRFPKDIHHQDLAAIPYACLKSESAVLIKKRLYNYSINSMGVTKGVTDKHVLSPFAAIEALFDFMRKDDNGLFEIWFDDLLKLSFETFYYNFSIRKNKFKDAQIEVYIDLFNEFCVKYLIEPVVLLNCEASYQLVNLLIQQKTRRGLKTPIVGYSGNRSFELLYEHYRLVSQQYGLMVNSHALNVQKTETE